MKKLIFITSSLMLMVSISTSAQSLQGEVYYFSKSKVHILIKTDEFSEEMKYSFKKGQQAASQKRHVLEFNKTSFLFTEEISININPSLGMRS